MKIKLTFKDILIYLFTYLIVGILIVLLIKQCGNSEPTQRTSNKDSLNTIIAEKEQIAEYAMNEKRVYMAKFDSLLKVKPKYVKGRDRTHDSLIFVSDSICINSLNILYNECQKVDSVNNLIIYTQTKVIQNDSTIITNFKDLIAIQKHRIKTDSVDIEYLNLTVKKEKRKGKLKTILGTALGVIGGGLIGSFR